MSTTAIFRSAPATDRDASTSIATATKNAMRVHTQARPLVLRSAMTLRFPRSSVLERPAEREQQEALLIVRLGIERLPQLDAQRPHGREPAHAGPRREAGVVERDRLVGPVGVARVGEDDPLEADRLHEGEDDLVVENDLLAAPDRRVRDHPSQGILAVLAGPQRPCLEPADGVDATREVALEEWQVVPPEAAVPDPVAERAAERVGEVTERLRVQERVVQALAGLEFRELLAAQSRRLDREVLQRARRRVERMVQRVARQVGGHAADQARPLLDPDRGRSGGRDIADLRLLEAIVAAHAHVLERDAP